MFKIKKYMILIVLSIFATSLGAAELPNQVVGDMNIRWQEAQDLWNQAKAIIADIKVSDAFADSDRKKQDANKLILQSLKLLPVYVKNDSIFNKSIGYRLGDIDFQRIITGGDFLYLGTGFGESKLTVAIYGAKVTGIINSTAEVSLDGIANKLLALSDFNNPAVIIKLENLNSSLSTGEGLREFFSRGQTLLASYLWTTMNKYTNVASQDGYVLETASNIDIIFQNMQLNNLFIHSDAKGTLQENISLLFPRVNFRGRDIVKATKAYFSPASSSNQNMSLETACYILGLPTDKNVTNEEINMIVENYIAMLNELLSGFNTQKVSSISSAVSRMIAIIKDAGSIVLHRK